MFKFSKSIAAAVIALATAGVAYAPSASAANPVPLTLTQQGRLLDNTGAAVDGVQLTFTFSLYTSATAGTAIWTENQSITPDKGYFSAKIGDSTAFPAMIFDGSQPTLYLGIKIGSDAEMSPRQELTSVPFALLAANALNATHAVNADSATNASNAMHATNADNATKATNADNAATVTSITGNILDGTATNAANTATITAKCPDGYGTPVGGGCTNLTANTTLNNAGFGLGKGYTCSCNQTCSLEAVIICAK